MPEKLSAFVITYNRASLLETCLRAVSFADELIVVDKSSTDNSAAIAFRHADRVEVVPWSPTVEETRAFALSLCHHEWVLCLDDDEVLSPETGPYLRKNLGAWNADIVAIPLRHYILGVHDERAYYWPEVHHRLFRKGAVEFIPTVHGGIAPQSDRVVSIPADSGVCIHHLSYRDVAGWIERANRYTSRPDRVQPVGGADNLIQFAHDQIDHWMRRTADPSANDYPAAVALLRAIYDMVDRLKAWETDRGIDGAEMFRIAQNHLAPAIEGRERHRDVSPGDGRSRPRRDEACQTEGTRIWPSTEPEATASVRHCFADKNHMALQATLVQLRAAESQLRDRTEAARKSNLCLIDTRKELDETIAALADTRVDLDQSRATIDRTRLSLDQTLAALGETRATLGQTRAALDETVVDLTKVNLDLARLSGSARLFIRQYVPKLRRQLWRRIAAPNSPWV